MPSFVTAHLTLWNNSSVTCTANVLFFHAFFSFAFQPVKVFFDHLPDKYLCTRFLFFDLGSYLLM